MKQISTSLTSKLRTDSITERDYIIFSGEEEKHYIWFYIYDDCYNNGNFIGTFVMKRIEFTYNDSDLEFKQKEFNAYKEYKLDDGTWESIDYGTFIVQAVEESDTKEEIKVTAYDYTLKFANPYVSELDYSSGTITLLQVIQECCTKCGVELATTDFANSGFLVDSNQFDGISMFGNVVSAVASISCNFAKIKTDNKLYLEFKNETGIIIDVSDYEEFDDKRDTHPYNAVSLGVSGVEGENVTLVDESVEPGKENYLTINDNPFAYTQEKRNELIQAIFDKVNGFGYSSFELDNCMYPQLECGDLIQIRNKEGQLVDSIVLRLSYEKTNIKLEAPSIISATVTYQNPPSAYDIAKQTQIIVDKQEQTITQLVSKTESISNDLENNYTTNSELENVITQTIEETTNLISQTGGFNLLLNSQFYQDLEEWTKTDGSIYQVITGTSDVEQNTSCKSELEWTSGTLSQTYSTTIGKEYTISFKYKKQGQLDKTSYVRIYRDDDTYISVLEASGQQEDRKEVSLTYVASVNNPKLVIFSDSDDFYITDLIVQVGTSNEWSPNVNETRGLGHTLTGSNLNIYDVSNSGNNVLITPSNITFYLDGQLSSNYGASDMSVNGATIKTRMVSCGITRKYLGDDDAIES